MGILIKVIKNDLRCFNLTSDTSFHQIQLKNKTCVSLKLPGIIDVLYVSII